MTHRNPSWHRILGYCLGYDDRAWHETIREIPVSTRSIIDRWVRPIVTITAQECSLASLPLGESRFLGAPDLPAGFSWPVCAHGPLIFQAQINLSDLRHSVATHRFGLPSDGWLVLFAFDDEITGYQPGVVSRGADRVYKEVPDLTLLTYIPASAELVRFALPTGMRPWNHADFACSLTFGESLDIPWGYDTDDPRLHDEGVSEWMASMRGGWGCKLMGYPWHGRTENTSPGPDWRNLITLGSIQETGWSWCDGQHLDVYVHEDGLRNRSFHPFYGYAA
ncbi:DUF1963 domain-containing protein [Tuwongella immobilis]